MNGVSDDTRYGFAIGRLRSLETALFDRGRWDRLVRTRSIGEFHSVLADTGYARYTVEDETGLDGAFGRAAEDNFAFFEQYCLDEFVLDIFRLRADVHNLKVTVKAELVGREVEPGQLLAHGRWNGAQLAALAAAGDKAEPAGFRDAVVLARRSWEAEHDPALVDTALDRAAQAATLAACGDNGFLVGYFALLSDVHNLRTLVRVRLLGEDRAVLDDALLPGGTLTPAQLATHPGDEWETLAARFRTTPYARMMEEGIVAATGARSLLRLERLGRELALEWLRRARYLAFGFEPLVAYYLLREGEIANLRRLAAAKAAGLDEADCAELVAYVE